MKKDQITAEDFENAITFLNKVRFENEPSGSLIGLDSLKAITDVFEQAIDILRRDSEFLTGIGLERKFRMEVKYNSWWEISEYNEIKERIDRMKTAVDRSDQKYLSSLKQTAIPISIEKIIDLGKIRRNGISGLVLCLRQHRNLDEAYIGIEVWNKNKKLYHNCYYWNLKDLKKKDLILLRHIINYDQISILIRYKAI